MIYPHASKTIDVKSSLASFVSFFGVVDDEVRLVLLDTPINFSDVAAICDTLVGFPDDVAVYSFFDVKDNGVLYAFSAGGVVASVAVNSSVLSITFLIVKCVDSALTNSVVKALLVPSDLVNVANSVAFICSVVLPVSLTVLSEVSMVVTPSLSSFTVLDMWMVDC